MAGILGARPKKPAKVPAFKPYKPTPFKGPGSAKPTVATRRALAAPRSTPTGDYGQDALYPGGYQGKPNPVDWSKIFSDVTYGKTGGQGGGADGAGGGAGGMPNYDDLVNNYWGVQEAESMAGGMRGRAEEALKALVKRAVIDYGYEEGQDTSKFGAAAQYLDADTLKAAQENKYSTLAETKAAEEKARAQAFAARAARGGLSSGGTTNVAEEIGKEGERTRYTGLRQAQGAIEGGFSQRTAIEDQIANMMMNARQQAAAFAAENYIPPTGAGAGTDPYSSLRGRGGNFGNQGPAPTPAQLAGVSSQPLSQRAFMSKNPRGNYYNYLRAWHRHAGNKWG